MINNKKPNITSYFSFLIVVISFLILSSSSLYAGEAISVTGGTWNIQTQEGTLHAGEQVSSPANQWTVTGSEDGSEEIYIRVECPAGCQYWSAWNGAGSPAQEEFTLRENNAGGYLIKSIDALTPWITLQESEDHQFGLWFEAPPVGSTSATNTLTVTLTAKEWCEAGCDLAPKCKTGTCDGPGGSCGWPNDDGACGIIDCDGLDNYYASGTPSPTGPNYCKYDDYHDLDGSPVGRCEQWNDCKDPNSSDCTDKITTTENTCDTCCYAGSNCPNCTPYHAGTQGPTPDQSNQQCGNACMATNSCCNKDWHCTGTDCSETFDMVTTQFCGPCRYCSGTGSCIPCSNGSVCSLIIEGHEYLGECVSGECMIEFFPRPE